MEPFSVDEVVDRASGIADAGERTRYLDRVCASDPALRTEVERRLATLGTDVEFHFDDDLPDEKTGEIIGRYRLAEVLGEGGFGTVWRAEQTEPVRREVALKIIKLGMDTRQVIARFEQERQALALMDHPGIARVLDAGATASGRPYFVMDLVRGEPIGAWCDRHRVPVRGRLELFTQVCSAVQHAHGKGVIHRDLKPSNLLVGDRDGRPHATVIDFGIAKAVHGKLTDQSLVTAPQQLIGTLAYMSPEQAEGSPDIDTRTDVYALGVVLYELLTGVPPLNPRADRSELQRLIREVEPPPPSSRIGATPGTLTEASARRGVEPGRLGGLLRGELDWIALKTLEKERGRRYETVAALAADIGRHLSGEPVLAAPPSRAYRWRKFARRHRAGVAAAAVAVAALVAGATAAVWGMVQADEHRRQAEEAARQERSERRQAEAVAGVLERLLYGVDPYGGAEEGGVPFKEQLIEGLDEAVAGMSRFAGDAPTTLRLQEALGLTFVGLSEHAKAERLFRAAWESRRARPGDDPDKTWRAALNLASALQHLRRPAEALEMVETARRLAAAAGRPTYEFDHGAAMIHRAAGRSGDAIRMLEDLRVRLRQEPGTDPSEVLLVGHNLGAAYRDVREFDKAIAILEEVHGGRTQRLGAEHPETLTTANSLAVTYAAAGRHADAARLGGEALTALRRRFGADHKNVLQVMNTVAVALHQVGRTAESVAMVEEAAERARARFGTMDPLTLDLDRSVVQAYERAERWDDAIRAASAALRPAVEAGGLESASFNTLMMVFARTHHRSGRGAELLPEVERWLSEASSSSDATSPGGLRWRGALGLVFNPAGAPGRAIEVLRDVAGIQSSVLGPEHADTLDTLHRLGCAHFAEKDSASAIACFEKVVPGRRAALGPLHRETLRAQDSLGAAYFAAGDLGRSIPLLEDALEKLEAGFGTGSDDAIHTAENLAVNYHAAKQPGRVVDLLKARYPLYVRACAERPEK